MKRLISMALAMASVALIGGGMIAQAGIRPDDRVNHGTGAVALAGSPTSTRPDDRAWRGVGPAPVNKASAGVRPDDRATHGPGALGGVEVVRPDDRGWRGVGPAPTIFPIAPEPSRIDGFDWDDAVIGAAGAFGLILLLSGASMIVMRHRRVAAFS